MSVSRLAVESRGSQRLHPVSGSAQPAAAASAPFRSSSATNPVYIWHDVDGREPYFDAPDVFESFSDDKQRRRLLHSCRSLPRDVWNCILSTS